MSLNASSGLRPLRSVSALLARVPGNPERVIIPINAGALRKDATTPAFYCVHSVTGTAGSEFAELAHKLDPLVRFYGIQATTKRMGDPEHAKSVESLAVHYADALMAFQPKGPFLLGGHCAGGIVALEIAQILRARGREIALLIAIDAVPENTGAGRGPWNPLYLLELACNVPRWIAHEIMTRNWSWRVSAHRIAHNAILLARAATGRKRGEKFRGGYGIDGFMDMARFPPEQQSFINRFYAALFTYVPKTYPGSLVVYEANLKPLLYLPQTRLRWRAIAPYADVVGISGNHNTMLEEPYLDELAKHMRSRIIAAAGDQGHAHTT